MTITIIFSERRNGDTKYTNDNQLLSLVARIQSKSDWHSVDQLCHFEAWLAQPWHTMERINHLPAAAMGYVQFPSFNTIPISKMESQIQNEFSFLINNLFFKGHISFIFQHPGLSSPQSSLCSYSWWAQTCFWSLLYVGHFFHNKGGGVACFVKILKNSASSISQKSGPIMIP